MKTLHKINIIALATTLLLYCTILFGMYAQIVLGPLQLLLALIISFRYYQKLNSKLKKGIIVYWILAATSLFIVFIFWNYFKYNDFSIVVVFVIPMLIACYFAYLTYKITQHLTSAK